MVNHIVHSIQTKSCGSKLYHLQDLSFTENINKLIILKICSAFRSDGNEVFLPFSFLEKHFEASYTLLKTLNEHSMFHLLT